MKIGRDQMERKKSLFSVEIDCQQIFLTGQLGVAIGRCTCIERLRVINFQKNICLPQPEEVQYFLNSDCLSATPDLHCCRKIRYLSKI